MVQNTVAHPHDPAPLAGWHYPREVAEFRAWFGTDSACLAYLDWLRWPDGFVCPHCSCNEAGKPTPGVYRCHGCRRRVTVTSGTMFDRTRVPLTTWFEAIWLFTVSKAGVSATTLQRVLPINSIQTAWTMLGKLRVVTATSNREPLSGRVEVDETFFGGPQPGKTGRGARGKVLVAGAIEVSESGWGRARMAVIPNASRDALQAFVVSNIAPGSTVITDAWKSYPPALNGYNHEPMNVSASGLPAHESLPAIHRIFSLVKRLVDGTYQGGGSPKHLQEYLDEFVFRFNRRKSQHRGLLFMRLLQLAVESEPTTYRQLTQLDKPGRAKSRRPPTKKHRKPGSMETPQLVLPWTRPAPPS